MSLKGSRLGSNIGGKTVSNEEISKINQDLTILQSRISHLNGEPIISTPSSTALIGNGSVTSPFVSGLRGLTSDTSKTIDNSLELKIEALESVLQKIIELDRLVLKKTMPVDVTAVRRKSNGTDLYLLPTHLHLADRLMDLHAQSKRVTVITQTIPNNNGENAVSSNTPNPPLSPRSNKKLTDTLQNSINDLKKQLQEADDKNKRNQEEIISSRKDIMALRQELDNTKLELEQQKLNAKSNNDNELNNFKAQFSEMQERNNQMQDWLLTEKKKNQSLLLMIKEKSDKLEIKGAITPSKSEQLAKVEFNSEEIEVFSYLDSAIALCFENLRTQIMTISSVKDMLESEIQNYTMEREILMKDLRSLTNDHDALKGAYHALETESMNKKGDNELQKKLTAAQEMIEQVQSELASMARRSLELERLPPLLSELEIKFKASEDARIKNDFKVKEVTEELSSYKVLCEKLKQKIRDMSGKDSKTQDFLDSFEEVMRDEMMTMKIAFEAKLKQAKEEADANSRRHQEEISRLSSGSPYLSLGLRKDSMGNFIRS
jgi:chromosome segregation ATPase